MSANSSKPYGRDGLMITSAVRYCIGRMTYIVSDCVDWIVANWGEWPDNVKTIIQRDIEEAFQRDDADRDSGRSFMALGHDCDREQWERVRALWKTKS